MDHRKLNFPMKKPLPCKNTLLAIAKGDSVVDDNDCLVDNEELPQSDYYSEPATPVTVAASPVTMAATPVTVTSGRVSYVNTTPPNNPPEKRPSPQPPTQPPTQPPSYHTPAGEATAEGGKRSSRKERRISAESFTIVNPLHAHLNSDGTTLKGGSKTTMVSKNGHAASKNGQMDKLHHIKQSIKKTAGTIGEKLNIKLPNQSSKGADEIRSDVVSEKNDPYEGPTYTIDEAIDHIGMGRYQITWFILLGLSSMAQASEIALASVILSDLICEWDMSVVKASLIPALVLMAALPGGWFGGVMADKRGRKQVLIGGQWLIMIFGVLSAFMNSYHAFVLIRMVVGFGFGIVTSLVIVHVSEIAPPKYRAYSIAINVFMWSVGDCFVVLMGYYALDYGWSVVVLAACLPALIMCIIILFLDESPRYLSISDNVNEAERILSKIAMINYSTLPEGRLKAILEPERGNVLEMFSPKFKKTSMLLLFSVFSANLVYYGNIFSLPYLFKDDYCGVYNSSSSNTTQFREDDCTFSREELMATLEVSAAEFLSIPIFALLVEKLGRVKTGMMLGVSTALFTTLCVPCLNLILFKLELFLQRMVVNAWLLLIFIYSPELYPTYIRSAAFGIVMVFCNLGGVFSSLIVYDVGTEYSFRAMFLFLVPFAIAGAIVTFYFKEETKGRNLVDNKGEQGDESEKIPDEKCCDRRQVHAY